MVTSFFKKPIVTRKQESVKGGEFSLNSGAVAFGRETAKLRSRISLLSTLDLLRAPKGVRKHRSDTEKMVEKGEYCK